MADIGLLTFDQLKELKLNKYIKEPNGSDVFKKDGGYVNKEGRISEWTMTPGLDGKPLLSLCDNNHSVESVCDTTVGFRPAFYVSSLDEIMRNGFRTMRLNNGVWFIDGRYVPMTPVPHLQERLNKRLINGNLKCVRRNWYPKFQGAIKHALATGKYDSSNVEWLDKYQDGIDIYAVRQLGENRAEFELCKPEFFLAEQIEEGKIIVVGREALWGGIPFDLKNGYKKDEDFPNTLLGRIMNVELRHLIDLTEPERKMPFNSLVTKSVPTNPQLSGDALQSSARELLKLLEARENEFNEVGRSYNSKIREQIGKVSDALNQGK